jgi:hypothetical protein
VHRVLHNLRGNTLAVNESLMVQVRRGELLAEDYAAIMAHVRRVTAARTGNLAFIGIVEPDAKTVAPEVRAMQREFITEMLERLDARVGAVILGDDIGATMRRTMARMMIPGHGRIRVVATVEQACAFVCPHVGISVESGLAFVREVQAAARRAL